MGRDLGIVVPPPPKGEVSTKPGQLHLEDVVPQSSGAVRTEFLSLLSYRPDELILVLDGGLTDEDREAIIASHGCLVRERLWSSSYDAPMYILNIPDDKTELEMLKLFNGLVETRMVEVAIMNSFDPIE
ncbi:MAG: hypothetical protein MUO70_01450 [Euryarchaeota archaeon]|nr:hypothetical protein [Euryarchaeota archaeon]